MVAYMIRTLRGEVRVPWWCCLSVESRCSSGYIGICSSMVPVEQVPTDLAKALKVSAKVTGLWQSLTPVARRDWVSWVTSAKQPETRARRIAQTSSKLLAGKRRPCCYSVVPMNLYGALGKSAKAKATWNTLTPDGKRDFAHWVEAGKDSDDKRARVEKACDMLAAGRVRP